MPWSLHSPKARNRDREWEHGILFGEGRRLSRIFLEFAFGVMQRDLEFGCCVLLLLGHERQRSFSLDKRKFVCYLP